MRRVACVSLIEARLEVAAAADPARAAGQAAPPARERALAVIVARPGSAVQSERDVRGGTRLDVVSRRLCAFGVRAGDTVAAARAKCADMRVRVVTEAAVDSALVRVAEAALAFGPAVGFDTTHDVVWVEIGGCAHLHGDEAALARALASRVRSMGHACRVAIADGPRVAAAVARFASDRRGPRADGARIDDGAAVLIVPEGQGRAAVAKLPISALGLDGRMIAWLSDLGLRSCGDLQRLPRRAFGTRLGARARDVLAFLDGEDNEPLAVWRPPEVPEERFELDWGATSTEALAFVTKTLCDRIAVRLAGRAMAAARVEVALDLDRALCGERPARSSFEIVLPAPLARAADLQAVVRARMQPVTVTAPVFAVTLRVPELAGASGRTLELLAPEPKAQRALPRLVAELSAELGRAAVGTLRLVDTWVLPERTRLLPFGAPADVTPNPLVTSALEPSRVIAPVALDPATMTSVERLVTIEAVEWWRRRIDRRHWVAAWTSVGSSAEALAWVEVESKRRVGPVPAAGAERAHDGEASAHAHVRGWID